MGEGDLMLAATDLLRPGPARIGGLGRLTLPRAVRLRSVAAGTVGGAVGLFLGAAVAAAVGGHLPMVAGACLGALAGHLAVNVEPLPGDNLLSWLYLTTGARRAAGGRVVLVDAGREPPGSVEVARAAGVVAVALPGRRRRDADARVAVGCCLLDRLPVGQIRIVGGLVAVAPGSVDRRGRPVALDVRRSGRSAPLPRR